MKMNQTLATLSNGNRHRLFLMKHGGQMLAMQLNMEVFCPQLIPGMTRMKLKEDLG
ncbi:hypothetical protein Ocin01_16652 [Orchesella cincta]|uniref:Uncharacterized protein n=1 Tax=Orchesella cincta TaxID=48709 RepID=A0A1D2MAR3_ORCCI|nr:hypothetical protein Ocin01_16652 [Orchesella cincta]